MTLKTSLLITGDSKVATKAVDDLRKSVEAAGAAAKGAAGGVAAVGSAEEAAAKAARALSGALLDTNAAVREMAEHAKAASAALGMIAAASNASGGSLESSSRRIRQHSEAINDNEAAARRNAFGLRNLGQQFGDMGVMVGGGISPLRAFATQAGQMGYALSEMTGKAGAVGAFLTGPWGIALTVGISLLSPFIDKLMSAGDAADVAAKKLDEQKKAMDRFGLGLGALAGQTVTARTATEAFNRALADDPSALTAKNAEALAKARIEQAGATYRAAAAEVALRQSAARSAVADLADGSITRTGTRTVVVPGTRVRRTEQYQYQEQLGTTIARGSDGLSALTRAQRDAGQQLRQADADAKALDASYNALVGRIQAVGKATGAAGATVKTHTGNLRAHKAATSDADAENKRLETSLDGIISKFAALDDGGKGYAETLRKIADLTAKGKIDPFQSAILTGGVFAAQNQARQKAMSDSAAQYFTAGGQSPEQQIRAIVDTIDRGAEVAGQTFEDHVLDAAKGVAGALDKAGGILSAWFPGVGSSTLGQMVQSGSQLSKLLGSAGEAQRGELKDALQTLGEKALGLNKDAASEIAEKSSKAIKGAAEGALANSVFEPIAGALGIKTSKTGAQIGGAVGELSAIPGGSIIGSIVGSIIGGLFKDAKTGYAQIRGSGDTAATITGTYGTKSGVQSNARTLAGGVLSAVEQLASSLGGRAGGFNLDIGQKDDKFVVNTADHGGGKSDTYSFSSQEEALSFAVKNAVSDGAILGISAAMKRALEENSDIDTGVAEALKVKQVEATIADLGDTLKAQFAAFDTAAADALATAQKYNLDVLALEKKNGEDRAKLAEQLLKAQVGSLQSLVTELTSGDLFEGSYTDKIAALNVQIAKARSDLEAGVDGAADNLADFLKQRLAVEKDAYGTTGAYASSRNSTIAEAQAAIAAANAKITAAQTGTTSDPALATTNSTLDEMSDQNAQIIAELRAQNALLTATLSNISSGSSFDLQSLVAV